MDIPYIRATDVDDKLDWRSVVDALEKGHKAAPADIADMALKRADDTLLNRAAWIDGLGLALKSVTIFPKNTQRSPALPSIHGVVILFDDATGEVKALFDGALVTKWKTAADSVLGAKLLARPNPKKLLIVGSGVVSASLIAAYAAQFPTIETISIWSRTLENAQRLAASTAALCDIIAVSNLADAVASADIVSSATLAKEPIILGEWVQPGTHIDLIGAFRSDMREADDCLMQKAEIFVDARKTTIEEIGELMIPIANGAITPCDVHGDLYDLCNGAPGRPNDEAITLFKNGGGAHLDLMTANVIHDTWRT